jgi:hypothetical protein
MNSNSSNNSNSDNNNNSAPFVGVANQDLMRRMEQISRRVAGTLQKKQDNSYRTNSTCSSNNNNNKSPALNSTEWIVVHLAREILQRRVRVQAMIAAGYLHVPAAPSPSPSTVLSRTASKTASKTASNVGGAGPCNNDGTRPKEATPHEQQDHWNPAFVSWETLIANWIRDGRLVAMMLVMNDAHSSLQQQQQQQQSQQQQQHQVMDDVAIDRMSQMLGIHAEQWETLCQPRQRNQKQEEPKDDSSNHKASPAPTDPAPAPETAKNSYPSTSASASVSTTTGEMATNPISGTHSYASMAVDPLSSKPCVLVQQPPQQSLNNGTGNGADNGGNLLSTRRRIVSPSDAMTTTSLMATTASASQCSTKDQPSNFGKHPGWYPYHDWKETSVLVATAATTTVAADNLPEPVPFRHAGSVADFVLASSCNNSDSKNQNQNKTRTAPTSTDTSTQVQVPLVNSEKEPKDWENLEGVGPTDDKCFHVGIKAQQRYLQLCHANTCKSDNCPPDLNCPEMKLLCRHIVDCRSDSCGYRGCLSSRSVLRHAAVLRHIRRSHDRTNCQECLSTRNCSAAEPSTPAPPAKVTKPVQTQVQIREEEHRPIKKRRVTLDTANV